MNLKWIVLASAALVSAQVFAQAIQPQTPAEGVESAKQRMANSKRVSPKERAALATAEATANNQKEGDGFLQANRSKPGVKLLPTGVQYKIIKAGTGKKATDTSSVVVRYEGKLIDGTGFDKVDDKKGSKLLLKGFVPGLQDAIKRMPAGSKWELVVPPEQGFGANGTHNVGPNAVLIYQLEVLSVI